MKDLKDCRFCSLISDSKNKAVCLYEDELSYVIFNDRAREKGNTFFIFRGHGTDFSSLNEEDAKRLGESMGLVASILQDITGSSSLIYLIPSGESKHLCYELIPVCNKKYIGEDSFILDKDKGFEDSSEMIRLFRDYIKYRT